MKKVLIVRGVPGCGKTTYVEDMVEKLVLEQGTRVVCSADDFFKGPDGVYRYDPLKLVQAHQYALWRFMKALQDVERGLVVADNTFVRSWEYRNYEMAARLAGWDCEVHEFRVETVGQIRACHKRCRHGVPLEVIARMAVEFELWHEAKVVEFRETAQGGV